MTDDATTLAERVKRNLDIDLTNDVLRDANALNAILGHPERYELLKYPA